MVDLIAFYLPQYHRTPENDAWWGEGFTEWVNVKKARPLFRGHYQPREPLNDNYYDLSDDGVMEWQMKLAKKYGVGGFCFYHYWFGDKMMLEKPVERLLDNKKADLPFCIAWANEDWKRTWQGIKGAGNREILIKQQYGDSQEWERHFNYLLPFFKDERYIKEGNKPMFVIYKSGFIPKGKEMFGLWDSLARKNGFDGMFLVDMQTAYKITRHKELFSATVDFVPARWRRDKELDKEHFVHKWKENFMKSHDGYQFLNRFLCYRLDYDKVNQEMLDIEHKRNEFRGVFVNYDDGARRGREGTFTKGFHPKAFERYLTQNIKKSVEEGNRYLFINAWNEWGEGNYLEPDKKYGYAYLHAVRRALLNNGL